MYDLPWQISPTREKAWEHSAGVNFSMESIVLHSLDMDCCLDSKWWREEAEEEKYRWREELLYRRGMKRSMRYGEYRQLWSYSYLLVQICPREVLCER
jgi:hypothetical protein